MPRPIHYADQFQPDFGFPWHPKLPEAELRKKSVEELKAYMDAWAKIERYNVENPVGAGFKLPVWDQVMKHWGDASIHVLLGGNQCVRFDTQIFDPVRGRTESICDLKEPSHVLSWNGKGLIAAEATPAFIKGRELMMCITWKAKTTDGIKHGKLVCTADHKIMLPDGEWGKARDLKKGDYLFCPNAESGCATINGYTVEGTFDVWDITVPETGNYWHQETINSNSGKTTFGARLNLWAAATIPSAETYAFHVSERRSIDDQQRFVYEALPITLKNLPTKKGIHHSLQYTQKNGFTDNIAILPPHPGYNRGGSIAFYNFQQYLQNDQIIEGIKAHFVWADELIPLPLFETLKYRLFTYHGRMLLTYTVVDGWNDTIQKIMASTKTLKTRFCDHPKVMADLPIMQKSLSVDDCLIHYAWTQDNPFTDYKQFLKLNATANKSTILARAFGVPTKSLVGIFPGFSQEVNVVPHADLPFIKNPAYPVSRFMSLDPGGSKHWFMVWVAIDASGTWWVYREWPDASYGEWALPGNKAGPAQEGTNKGIKDYVEIIKNEEGTEVITDRIIDPRSGAAQKQAEDGATNIISQLDDQDMVFHPAPGGSTTDGVKEIDDGLQMITDLLAYKQDKPRDAANCPRLYISDNCPNVIFALREYTAKLGQSEKCKESVDCLRYLRKSGCEFYNSAADRKQQQRTGVY